MKKEKFASAGVIPGNDCCELTPSVPSISELLSLLLHQLGPHVVSVLHDLAVRLGDRIPLVAPCVFYAAIATTLA